MISIKTHIYSSELIKINPRVITISMSRSISMSFLKSIRSMMIPMRGARITAGNIAIAAVRATVRSEVIVIVVAVLCRSDCVP